MPQREIVEQYEMLYGVRTGLTVLLPPLKTLEVPVEVRVRFAVEEEGRKPGLLITADGHEALLKNVSPQHIEQAMRHGVIMFYEMKGDDVVRCTPCYKD